MRSYYLFYLFLLKKIEYYSTGEKLKQMEKIHLERNNTLLAEVKTVIPLNQD